MGNAMFTLTEVHLDDDTVETGDNWHNVSSANMLFIQGSLL
jgi:hypothetical protein